MVEKTIDCIFWDVWIWRAIIAMVVLTMLVILLPLVTPPLPPPPLIVGFVPVIIICALLYLACTLPDIPSDV